VAIRIDMTPMVDIAFLLLIFYMVTTLFSAPKAMEISLPPDKSTEVPVKQSDLLFLRVTEDGTIYQNFGIKETPKPITLDSLRGFLLEQTKELPDDLVILVKLDPEAKYHKMVDIIDEIQVVESKMQEVYPDYSSRFSIAPFDDFDRKVMSKLAGVEKEKGSGK
jgi:biopolymer transport protein ExbD